MLREIKVSHLEPTDVCQAACPACARETDLSFDKSSRHHLTIEQIQHHINEVGIKNLNKMFMCGNYGDPAAGKYTLDIYRYFRKINPEIELGMNTNGAIQNTAWWQTLGEILHRQLDYVVFSIDGLEDTNHIYRRNVDWDKLIENAQAYISTGASAHWDMLVYRHNEHQVDECERLARSLGFTWFRAKVSKRPILQNLQYPISWQPPQKSKTQINCHALNEQSMYIDAQGRASPCCWLGSRQKDFISDIDQVMPTWVTSKPNVTCISACGQSAEQSNFSAQWRRETQLC
jgi:sulfatase maturation enzyme AslB (radical SAM superfamily)